MTMIEWYGYGEQRGEEEKMSVARCVPILMLREAEDEDGDEDEEEEDDAEAEMRGRKQRKTRSRRFPFLEKISHEKRRRTVKRSVNTSWYIILTCLSCYLILWRKCIWLIVTRKTAPTSARDLWRREAFQSLSIICITYLQPMSIVSNDQMETWRENDILLAEKLFFADKNNSTYQWTRKIKDYQRKRCLFLR